jgi:serine/threonine-protein kinase
MSVQATQETLPHRVGRYDVLFPLETGTVASIFVGRVAEAGASPVTIRRIGRDVTQGKDLGVLLARAREVPAVRHPNVVAVRDLFEEDDALCVVMDYLEGETAATVLRRLDVENKSLGFGLAAWVVAETGAGVDAGHEVGVVHGHLTPHDLFIGHDGTVRVFDIGIASAIGDMTGASTIPPMELPYAPPERCKGEALDRRSDVYALGVVLWELMTGVSPFERATDADTLRAILTGDPRLPPTSVLRSLPSELSEIALRALERDPAKRYPTALVLREALSAFVATAPMGGAEPSASLAPLMQNIFAKRIRNHARLLRRADSSRNRAVRSPLAIETPPEPIDPSALERPTVDAFLPVAPPAEVQAPPAEPQPVAPSAVEAPEADAPEPAAPEAAAPEAAAPEAAAPEAAAPEVEPVRVEQALIAFVEPERVELAPVEPAPVEPAWVDHVRIERPVDEAPADELAEEAAAVPQASPRRWALPAIVAVVAVVLAASSLAFLRAPGSGSGVASAAASSGPPRELPSSSSAATVVPSSSPTPPPAGAAETTLRIDTIPSKATIMLDGAPVGVSPMDVKVPRGDKPVVLELRRTGYQPLRESIVPDVDQKLRLVLAPAIRVGVPPPASAPAPNASAAPYHRFD